MRTDLWGWFNRFAAQAFGSGNIQHQQLVRLYDKGWQALRAEKHELAFNTFEEGLELARKLSFPCFELFYDYWCSETLIFYKNDYRTGLDRAIKMGARAHKDQYLECPVRGRVYYTLMYVYYAMDALGYEDKIREMIAFMENEIPLDDDTYQRTLYTRSSLAYALEDYDQAEKIIQQYLGITIGNAHRQSGGHNMIRMIHHARGNLKEAFDHAFIGEKNARVSRLENSVALSMLWQANYAKYLGDDERAAVLHQRGKFHHDQFDLKPLPEYYNAVCEYLELTGDMQQALELRRKQIGEISEVGSVSYTAHSHLQYVRLCGRAGEDITEALATTRKAGEALLKPQKFNEKLEKVESGDYYQYDWQKDYPRKT